MNIPLSRRDAIRLGLMSVAGVWISNRFSVPAWGVSAPATAAAPTGKAKAVIQVWLWGGPSHLDTFDPKPEAGNDYAGPLKAIETNVSGIRICELLPLLAKQAHRYALIRSMTHGNNGHETAAYIVQTGRKPGDSLVYPAMGAVVSLFKGYDAGYKGLVPPYIVLTEPQGRFSEAGFLGLKYKPFATGGDPSRTPFVVEGVVAQGISEQRQKDRRELRAKLDALEHVLPADPQIQAFQQGEKQAYDLILGDAGKVFDLTREKQELREQYGLNKFGQSCLLARRLVEQGVPYITINSGGWDTHKQNFETMRRKLPELDKGLATLLQDLADRGLLASTIVTCYGEFGRTPKIDWQPPWNGGRGHWGKVFSVLLAGGGFKGGQVVGASTEKGEEVKDRRVTPADLIASIYEQLGIDPNARLPHPQGLPVQVMPEATAKLKELV